jgi:hypothetical protein
MKKCAIVFSVLMMVSIISALEIQADERPAYDIILIVDKSISMEESRNLKVVKDFLSSTILTENVKIGDFLILMDFWGDAEVVDSFTVASEADLARARSIISSIVSTPRETNTDIGNAIDIAKYQIDALACTSRPKIVLMVTDGYQEAPRFSKYYSPDHKFSNAFLDTATTIAKKGWKIEVIEIGGAKNFMGAAATGGQKGAETVQGGAGLKGPQEGLKETTEQMGGQHKAVSEKPTVGELNQAVTGLTAMINVVQTPARLVVPGSKLVDLSFKVKGQSLTGPAVVVVKEVRIKSGTAIAEQNVLPRNNPVQFTVPQEGETELKTQLAIPVTVPAGDYPTDVQFFFEGDNTFQPSAFTVDLHVNSFLENNLGLFIALLAAGLVVLALLVFLIVRLIVSSGVKFRLKVEEQPLKKGKDVFKVGYGKWLYLNESYGRLSIAPKRSLRSIGRVYGVKKGLEFEPLREEQFPGLKAAKQNILGHKITVKTQDSATLHVEFIKV